MGLLLLNRFMSMQRGRHRRPTQGSNGLVTSVAIKKDSSPSLYDDSARSHKKSRYSGPSLPEDIWHHIYSLLPLRDAARVACVSHSFKSYWRCFPNLSLTSATLNVKAGAYEMSCKNAMYLARKTDHILKNHSSIGVKALKLEIWNFPFFSTSCDLDRWLHLAVKPGIEKLDLQIYESGAGLCDATLCRKKSHAALCRGKSRAAVYNFPCSLLDGSGKSIQQLHLNYCALRPTAGLGCLRRLTSLELHLVRITGDELRCLLSCSVALEKLTLRSCDELIFLEIPSLPQRLSHLVVSNCINLEAIKIKAPKLYSFDYSGALIALSLGDSLQKLYIDALLGPQDVVHYPWADLLRMVPHLEDLEIASYCPRDTLVVPGKFLHLRHLCIGAFTPDYDYLSLVSFLDACPSLETFTLCVDTDVVRQESVFGESSHDLRQMPGHMHRNIKDVLIIGFCSAKSMVELACHMLENAKSLEYLTLNTSSDHEILCSNSENGRCRPMSKGMRMEAHKALFAVERYILGKVPSTVKLEVVKPCSRCNTLEI